MFAHNPLEDASKSITKTWWKPQLVPPQAIGDHKANNQAEARSRSAPTHQLVIRPVPIMTATQWPSSNRVRRRARPRAPRHLLLLIITLVISMAISEPLSMFAPFLGRAHVPRVPACLLTCSPACPSLSASIKANQSRTVLQLQIMED